MPGHVFDLLNGIASDMDISGDVIIGNSLGGDAVAKVLVNPSDGKLHFKNRDSRYALMTTEDMLQDRLSLVDKTSGDQSEFQDVDALLLAGWAID